MSQEYQKPMPGVTPMGQLYGLLGASLDTLRSQFSGASFPDSPLVGQPCFRTDRESGVLYVYTGNPELGEAGWVDYALASLALSNLKHELGEARGSAPSLKARLNVALNDDGTLKGDAPAGDWWTAEADALAMLDETHFSVAGDKRGIYTPRRAIRLEQIQNGYGHVASSVYDEPADLTAVEVAGCVVDAGLSSVEYGQPTENNPLYPSITGAHVGLPAFADGQPGELLRLKADKSGFEFYRSPGGLSVVRQAVVAAREDADGYPDYLLHLRPLPINTLTGYDSGLVKVSPSAEYDTSSWAGWKILDGFASGTSGGWLTPANTPNGHVDIDFHAPQSVQGIGYTHIDDSSSTYQPRRIQLLGWDEELSAWDTLHDSGQRTIVAGGNSYNYEERYWFANTKRYRKFRINCIGSFAASQYVGLRQVRLFGGVEHSDLALGRVRLHGSDAWPAILAAAAGYDENDNLDYKTTRRAPWDLPEGLLAEASRNYIYADYDEAARTWGLTASTKRVHYTPRADVERMCRQLLRADSLPLGAMADLKWREDSPWGVLMDVDPSSPVQVSGDLPYWGGQKSFYFAKRVQDYIYLSDAQYTLPVPVSRPLKVDFCLEWDMRPLWTSEAAWYCILDTYNGSGIRLYYRPDKRAFHLIPNVGQHRFMWMTDDLSGAWHHVSLSRRGKWWHLHVDGKCLGSFEYDTNIKASGGYVMWGRDAEGSYPYYGYMNNMRYIVGDSVYQGRDYEVFQAVPGSMAHGTQRFDRQEGVMYAYNQITQEWERRVRLALGHVDTKKKRHIFSDLGPGMESATTNRVIDQIELLTSAVYSGKVMPHAFYPLANAGTAAMTVSDALDVEVVYSFAEPFVLDEYWFLATSYGSDYRAKHWTWYGSNDKANWTQLDARDDQLGGYHSTLASNDQEEERKYTLSNTTAYKHYKLVLRKKGVTTYQCWRLVLFDAATKHIPVIETVQSYVIGDRLTYPPFKAVLNTEYSLKTPFGGWPVVIEGELQGRDKYWRRKAGELSGWYSTSHAVNGEFFMQRSEEEVIMKTGNNQLSLYNGTAYDTESENYTEAIYYLTSKRA
ncbi:LamG-like jellyroll fold domain-containing protein [Desulfocurvibacter africanus]|uniref:LamG-like jellyroll fold domain-containing protein n=1 Tax=Desulfocurvibacter africanus TaxID=873 RepID=UPI00040F52CC|nr:LamG-like jellyroll fold domain-containing protein [Desulfocurvibacter africanus]